MNNTKGGTLIEKSNSELIKLLEANMKLLSKLSKDQLVEAGCTYKEDAKESEEEKEEEEFRKSDNPVTATHNCYHVRCSSKAYLLKVKRKIKETEIRRPKDDLYLKFDLVEHKSAGFEKNGKYHHIIKLATSHTLERVRKMFKLFDIDVKLSIWKKRMVKKRLKEGGEVYSNKEEEEEEERQEIEDSKCEHPSKYYDQRTINFVNQERGGGGVVRQNNHSRYEGSRSRTFSESLSKSPKPTKKFHFTEKELQNPYFKRFSELAFEGRLTALDNLKKEATEKRDIKLAIFIAQNEEKCIEVLKGMK